MTSPASKSKADVVIVVSVMCLAAFVAILCFVAARDPASRTLISIVVTGMGSGGLILFRQLRKTTHSLVASEARAQHAASHDTLTMLPNTALLVERMSDLMRQTVSTDARPILMCIGLDRVDETYETMGSAMGDEIVLEAAQRLALVGSDDDHAFRIRHDIFGLLLARATTAQAHQAAQTVLEAVAEPYRVAEGRAFVSCSIGLIPISEELDHPAEVIRRGQLALSHARKSGASRISLFDLSMDRALKERSQMEAELRQALADGDLSMVYQPQVNAKGTLIGVEALMRWTSQSRGEVSPSVFIGLADGCGLSGEIGKFALREAFQESRGWANIKVAINLSAAQIRSGHLVDTLKILLVETGAQARNIELEITEGVFLDDAPDVYETLHAVRKLGFSIALDDFGTGYSSLAYLRRFPVDKIKIDRSFVSQLGMRPESSAIIRAIVDLADALELKVIAEGVELRSQVERLTEVGCHQYQGFHFSPGVGARQIDALVSSGARRAA